MYPPWGILFTILCLGMFQYVSMFFIDTDIHLVERLSPATTVAPVGLGAPPVSQILAPLTCEGFEIILVICKVP